MTPEQRESAGSVWQAYNAMETTKQRHFAYLGRLDDKKKNFNLDPTEKENQWLADLLRDHDEQVKLFTVASQALKQQDPSAHLALFEYIGQLNQQFDEGDTSH